MRSKKILLGSVALCLGIVVWTLLTAQTSTPAEDVEAETARLQVEVASLKAQNDKLRKEVELLGGQGPASDARLAKAAREQLGYSRPDEVVLLVEPAAPPAPQAEE